VHQFKMNSQHNTNGISMHVTERHERSLFMFLIMFIIGRLRRFISPPTAAMQEDGSPKLSPTKAQLKDCTIVERTLCSFYVYDIIPPNRIERNVEKRIYYIAGGAWQFAASGPHWSMCAKMAKEMPSTAISLISMPLAPRNPAPRTFLALMMLYRTLMADADAARERVVFAGDSSGGNLVLCLTLEALKEDQTKSIKPPHPVAVMAICPSIDLTRKNPDIQNIAPRDPILTFQAIVGSAKAWHGDWDPTDRRVSPINNDISLLRKNNVKVHGITAGCDILYPDGVIFRDACSEKGIQGEWLHWENQMHCFPITQPYGLWQGKEAVRWIIDVLNKD
jgi:acetyl esterase/lipase